MVVRMTPRAVPLRPDDRRAAILAAVAPLVVERGPAVSTHDLACAAGVAEGTLFRVFRSKDELVVAAARTVFAEDDHLSLLAGIDPAAPLEAKLVEIVTIWQGVVRRFLTVYLAFGAAGRKDALGSPGTEIDRAVADEADRITAGLLAPDADRLRMPVPEVIKILGSLVLMSVHPMTIGLRLDPTQLVDLLLHGVSNQVAGANENPLDPHPVSAVRLAGRHTHAPEGPPCSGA